MCKCRRNHTNRETEALTGPRSPDLLVCLHTLDAFLDESVLLVSQWGGNAPFCLQRFPGLGPQGGNLHLLRLIPGLSHYHAVRTDAQL